VTPRGKPFLLLIALFQRRNFLRARDMHLAGVLKVFHHPDLSGEPTPAFASEAEIELAEQLRHQLEARLLETSVAPSSSKNTSAGTTGTINSRTR